MEGYLCFETPQAAMSGPIRNGNILFKGSCKDPAKHWKYSKKKSTPFHEAVSNGNHEIVRRVIQSLERYCEQQVTVAVDDRRPLFQSANSKEELLVHVLRQQDPSTKRTALQEAAGDQQVNLEILKELLRYPGIADPPDSTFKDALEDGIEIVVQTFLENDALSDRFVTSDNLIRAMELQHEAFRSARVMHQDKHNPDQNKSEGMEQETSRRTKIVYTLVEHAKTNHVFNKEVVQKIIECNLDEVRKKRRPQVQLDTSRLLHLAVFYQNVNFVRKFVAEFPDSVSQKALVPRMEKPKDDGKGHGYYPLWYNNKMWENSRWLTGIIPRLRHAPSS